MFDAVKVILPASVGVMLNVWAVEEFEKVSTFEERPALPVPFGVRVIVPVNWLLGVTVKEDEALLTLPEEGPVKVNVEATITAAFGTTELDAVETAELPAELVALTEKV